MRGKTMVTQEKNYTSTLSKEIGENKFCIRKELKNICLFGLYIYTDSEKEIHNGMTIRQPIMLENTELYFSDLY